MLKCSLSAASRVGCLRDNNEDMLLVGDKFIRDDSLKETVTFDKSKRYLLALADGMGGHNCGEVASSDVLHNLQFFYSDIPSGLDVGDYNELIYEWLNSMNLTIEAKGRVEPTLKDMGTTLVAFAAYEDNFYWMNCGDSRLYRFHDNQLIQMTTDHSLSNLMGEKTHSNVITNCVGGGCTTSYIDIVQCTRDVEKGDMFMLCSDGLTDMVSDEDISHLLANGTDASGLCDAAEKAGGLDNVSVILFKIEEL